ncbi:MAG: response regulator [Polyangiaceae bacterium]|nr:response regulator [Polyangiaceae bacterium]
MLSHELRNPLSAIVSAVALLEAEQGDTTSREIDVIKRQSRHMVRLLDDLLEASRIDRNKIELVRRVIDLRAVIDDAVSAMRARFVERGVSLATEASPTPLRVEGDAARLLQVVVNLLSNAVKFTPTGGSVLLTTRAHDGDAIVSVRDDGVGIDPAELGKVFDLFFQAKPSLARTDGGVGVGLALARRVAELHGGHVVAKSEGAGRGSEFTVYIPLARDALEIPETPSSMRGTMPAPGKTIVLVDDNADSCAMMEELLRREGYDVASAHDGQSGLELIDRRDPEIAIIDIGLPGLSGYEIARRVRTECRHPDIFLIALTGYGAADDRRAALETGFDRHLVKPVSSSELARVLRRPRSPATQNGLEPTSPVKIERAARPPRQT